MTSRPDRTTPDTMAHILDQLSGAGEVRARKMFGEYGVYCDDRFFGVVCANQLFIKPTPDGEALEPSLEHAPPYKGAKPSLLVTPDLLEDTERLAALVRVTKKALSPPKPKKTKPAIPRN